MSTRPPPPPPPAPPSSWQYEGPAAPLARLLREHFPDCSWAQAKRWIDQGHVFVDDSPCQQPGFVVSGGATLRLDLKTRRLAPASGSAARSDGAPRIGPENIVYRDRHVVVVSKPAGLSTVPYDDREEGTLAQQLGPLLRRLGAGDHNLGVVHRIDKETSGLLVFALTLPAKRALDQQFRFHTIQRRYVALAAGAPRAGTIRSRIIADRGDGRRGSTTHPRLGQESITHVEVLQRLEKASLITCQLETGRTHQIRIHLSEDGCPLLGDPVYAKGHEAGPAAPRLMLHAMQLAFFHPFRKESLFFEVAPPADFLEQLARLGGALPALPPLPPAPPPPHEEEDEARAPAPPRGAPRSASPRDPGGATRGGLARGGAGRGGATRGGATRGGGRTQRRPGPGARGH